MGNAFLAPSLFLPSLLLYSLSFPLVVSWAVRLYLSLPIFLPAPSLALPLPPFLSPSALLWVGGSMLYLIGVSLYRRRVALTGSESGSAHLPHVPNRTTCFFFQVLSWEDLLSSDSMTESKKKDKKGRKKGNKKGQKEKEGDPTKGKRKLMVVSVYHFMFIPVFLSLCVCVCACVCC